jgi:hypothetical protein
MRNTTITLAMSAAVIALGFAAAAEQKTPAKTTPPTAITVYKTPT